MKIIGKVTQVQDFIREGEMRYVIIAYDLDEPEFTPVLDSLNNPILDENGNPVVRKRKEDIINLDLPANQPLDYVEREIIKKVDNFRNKAQEKIDKFNSLKDRVF